MYKVNKIIIKVCLPNVNVILVSLPFFACLESRHLSDTQANEILKSRRLCRSMAIVLNIGFLNF